MSEVIKLPSGNTATIKDPKSLKQGDRKKIMVIAGKTDNAIETGLAIVDTLLSILIEEWSFDLVPPSVKVTSLDELSIEDYDALSKSRRSAKIYMAQLC